MTDPRDPHDPFGPPDDDPFGVRDPSPPGGRGREEPPPPAESDLHEEETMHDVRLPAAPPPVERPVRSVRSAPPDVSTDSPLDAPGATPGAPGPPPARPSDVPASPPATTARSYTELPVLPEIPATTAAAHTARRRAARAARRRAVRRRRFVALGVLVVIVAAIVFFTLRGCSSGDPFVGTWKSTATGASTTWVIENVQGNDYTVKAVGGTKTLPATRSDDTLTVKKAPPAKGVRMTLTPGDDANTLNESFPNGTTAVLKRQ